MNREVILNVVWQALNSVSGVILNRRTVVRGRTLVWLFLLVQGMQSSSKEAGMKKLENPALAA